MVGHAEGELLHGQGGGVELGPEEESLGFVEK